jgi:hypothetical protein
MEQTESVLCGISTIPRGVLSSIRRSSEAVLKPGNLYGFPTVASGSSRGRFVIEPTGVMLARFHILWSPPIYVHGKNAQNESHELRFASQTDR